MVCNKYIFFLIYLYTINWLVEPNPDPNIEPFCDKMCSQIISSVKQDDLTTHFATGKCTT